MNPDPAEPSERNRRKSWHIQLTNDVLPGSRRVAVPGSARLQVAVFYVQNEKSPSTTPGTVTTLDENM